MRAALRREPTPRIPCMPQICHDTPLRLYAGENGGDWIDGMARCLENPGLIDVHVCGNSEPILEMLADTGADAVEPLDPLGGVSVGDAKRRIGHRAALMGGVNTLTLANGSPDDVRAEAIRTCREGGPHGYVLAAGDMVPPQTSLANLQALVDVSTKSLWRD